MESRVGSLAVRVRAPADRVDALAAGAEEFAVRILRRCDEILEAQAPGRVVFVRQLELSLRLTERALGHEGEVEAFAAEIADAVDGWARAGGETPSGTPEVAVFADEVAWRAAHLEARSAGPSERLWCFEALEADGEPSRTLVESGPTAELWMLLVRLRQRGTLRKSLAALPTTVIDALARRIGSVAEDPPDRPAAGAAPVSSPEVVAACLVDLPSSTPPSLARICLAVTARDFLGLSAPEAEIAMTTRAALARFEESSPAATTSPDGVVAGEHGVASAFGGVFFLLNAALELSIGESLWHACLPEGLVLSHVAAALLGDAASADDPAPALFGGVARVPFPDVSAEQHAEVSLSLLAALRDALPRRGLAALPELLLRLVDTPGGRLLVAAEPSGPYALFAFPARSPPEMQAALEAFLGVWPASAPAPRATRALAELDRPARVRPVKATSAPGDLLIADGGSLFSRALATQIAGSLGHLFAARARVALPFSPMDIVIRYLSLPARVLLGHETMDVRIPMKHLAVDVRRAALDANPGWVPWLRRQVTFTYEEDPAAAAADWATRET